MKGFFNAIWKKPLRALFIFSGIGCITSKIIKTCKKKGSK